MARLMSEARVAQGMAALAAAIAAPIEQEDQRKEISSPPLTRHAAQGRTSGHQVRNRPSRPNWISKDGPCPGAGGGQGRGRVPDQPYLHSNPMVDVSV